jgi:hypothetical protein
MAICLVTIAIFGGLTYVAWPDASSAQRRDAVLVFLAIVSVGVPVVAAGTVISARSARRSARVGKRPSKATRGTLIGSGLVLAGLLEHASWQLIGVAALGAVMILATVCFAVIILMVSPEEEIRRGQTTRAR